MPDAIRQCLQRWRVEDLLVKYPDLRLRPTTRGYVTLAGTLSFSVDGLRSERIDDNYEIEIQIPESFPERIPGVRETKGRISWSFHKLTDGSLCLGSETRLRLIVQGCPSIVSFVERCVIPYLYGYSYFEKYGKMPFGELSHGREGILEDLAEVFGVHKDVVAGFVRLAAMKKGVANKRRCPCGSTRRVGKCHHNRINSLRRRLGRHWFRLLCRQVALTN
jgi:hypothetical protein